MIWPIDDMCPGSWSFVFFCSSWIVAIRLLRWSYRCMQLNGDKEFEYSQHWHKQFFIPKELTRNHQPVVKCYQSINVIYYYVLFKHPWGDPWGKIVPAVFKSFSFINSEILAGHLSKKVLTSTLLVPAVVSFLERVEWVILTQHFCPFRWKAQVNWKTRRMENTCNLKM